MSDSNTAFIDTTITCSDCQKPFVLTAGEQAWFAEKNLRTPKRCKGCRDQRRSQKTESPVAAPLPARPAPPANEPRQAPMKVEQTTSWERKKKNFRYDDDDGYQPRKKEKRRRNEWDEYDD